MVLTLNLKVETIEHSSHYPELPSGGFLLEKSLGKFKMKENWYDLKLLKFLLSLIVQSCSVNGPGTHKIH